MTLGIRRDDLARLHPQRLQRLELFVQNRIFGNSVRMELQIHPFVDAQAANFLDVARARSERQPVQGLQDLSILESLVSKRPPALVPAGSGAQQRRSGDRQCKTVHR